MGASSSTGYNSTNVPLAGLTVENQMSKEDLIVVEKKHQMNMMFVWILIALGTFVAFVYNVASAMNDETKAGEVARKAGIEAKAAALNAGIEAKAAHKAGIEAAQRAEKALKEEAKQKSKHLSTYSAILYVVLFLVAMLVICVYKIHPISDSTLPPSIIVMNLFAFLFTALNAIGPYVLWKVLFEVGDKKILNF